MTFECPSNLYEPMIQFLQYAHYESKKMRYFTCTWMEYIPTSFQHQLSFDCHQYFLACSGFISPLQSFPTSLLDSSLFRQQPAPQLPSDYTFVLLRKTVSHLLEVNFTPLLRAYCSNLLGLFHSSCFCLFPVSLIFGPKRVIHVKDTWNRCQTNLASWEDLGSSLLTLVQMGKNASSKRARNEYCNLTVFFFFLVYLIFMRLSPTYIRTVCLGSGGNWMKSNMVVFNKTQTKLLPWYSNTYICFSQGY